MKITIAPKTKRADAVQVFKALSDNNRLAILEIIQSNELQCQKAGKDCNEEVCLKDLSALLGLTLPTISHHVKELTRAGLITARKEGRNVYCQVNRKAFTEAGNFLSNF